MIFIKAVICFTFFEVTLELSGEVQLGEKTIIWNPVIVGCRLKVPQMTKLSHVRVAQEKLHIGVAIIDTVQGFSIKELV